MHNVSNVPAPPKKPVPEEIVPVPIPKKAPPRAEVSKKTVVEEKRFAAEERLSMAVPQRVELMRHEGI